jgi:hypothetical protein
VQKYVSRYLVLLWQFSRKGLHINGLALTPCPNKPLILLDNASETAKVVLALRLSQITYCVSFESLFIVSVPSDSCSIVEDMRYNASQVGIFFLVCKYCVIPLLSLVYGLLGDMHRPEKMYSLLAVLLLQEFALPYPEKIDYCLRGMFATPWRVPPGVAEFFPFAAENTPGAGVLDSYCWRR